MKIILATVVALAVLGGGVWYVYKPKVYPTPSPTVQVVESIISELAEISLTVTAPAKVATNKVTVTGNTAAGADVSINEANTVADAKGNFSLTVSLDEGENYLLVLAIDIDGKTAQKEIVVTSQTYE